MICWARTLFFAIVAVLGLGQMMVACGQKGDLYLPQDEARTSIKPGAKPATPATPKASATPAPIPDPSGEGLEALEDVPEVEPADDAAMPAGSGAF